MASKSAGKTMAFISASKTIASISAGKTMASISGGNTTQSMSSSLCELCGDDRANARCGQCKMVICQKCVKTHQKIPTTRDHVLEQLRSVTPSEEGSAFYDDDGDIHCSVHTSEVVAMICEPCAELICPSCSGSHSGHETMSITTDIHHLQDITMGSLQSMITGFKDLGLTKKNIAARSKLYEEAVDTLKTKWAEIANAGNKHVDLKCKEILEAKKDADSKLSGPMDSVSDRLTKTDDQISKLNMIKTSGHRHILLRGIQQSTVTQKLNAEFMRTNKKYKDVDTLKKMLPNIGQADDVIELMKSVFSVGDVDFSKFSLVGEQKVGKYSWRICDDGITDFKQIVLFYSNYFNISVLDNILLKLAHAQSNTELCHLVKVSDTKYIGASEETVTLLDSKYQVVSTKNNQYDTDEYVSKTICSNGHNSIIECCVGKTSPYKLNINRVDIRNNDFQSTNIVSFGVNTIGDAHCIFCRKRGNILVFAQESEISIINLNTKSIETNDESENIVGRIWSLCLDVPGYILVGDDGSVHVYRESTEYVMKIDVGGYVNGVVFVNDTLGVCVNKSGDSTLQKYKLKA